MKRLIFQISEKAYIKLLWLSPKPFRDEYGGPIAQVFRDQYRQAEKMNGSAGVVVFLFHATWDLVCSSLREQNNELMKNINIGHKFEKLTVMKFCLLVFLVTLVGFGVKAGMEPRLFRVSELLLVENNSPGEDTFARAGLISRELKLFNNLDEVIQRLDLQRRFDDSKPTRTPVSKLEARYLLNSMVVAQPALNTSVPGSLRRTSQSPGRENAVIQLTVTCKDKEMARQIAACFGELLVEKFPSESSSIQVLPAAARGGINMNPEVKVLVLDTHNAEETHPIAYFLSRTVTLGGFRSVGIGIALGLVFWCRRRMNLSLAQKQHLRM